MKFFLDPIHGPVRDPVRGLVRGPVRDPVRGPVRDPVRGPVRGPVRDPVLVLSTPFRQTTTDAKPLGSSLCRLSWVKLQNEDPRLNALFVVN